MLRRLGLGCAGVLVAFIILVIIGGAIAGHSGSSSAAPATATPHRVVVHPTVARPTARPTHVAVKAPTARPRPTARPVPTARPQPTTPPPPPTAKPAPTADGVAWTANLSQTLSTLAPASGELIAAATAGEGGDFVTGTQDIHHAQVTVSQAQAVWDAGPPAPAGNQTDDLINADVDAALRHYSAALSDYLTAFVNQDPAALASGLVEYKAGNNDFVAAGNTLLGH